MDPFIQKIASAATRLVDHEPDGTFEAVVSVFGNKDLQGDVMEPGAFKKSLSAWAKKGRPIPAVWGHQFHNPDMFLGKYLEQEETEDSLRLKGRLNLSWPVAQRVYELYKEELITEFSWSGRVTSFAPIEKGDEFFDEENPWKNGARIKEVDLWEAGPTFKGANPATELLSVKQATGLSVVRRDTADVLATLRDVHAQIGKAIASADNSGEKEDSADSTLQKDQAAELSPRTRALLALVNL